MFHKINQKEDTLESLSSKYKIKIDEIKKANGLVKEDNLSSYKKDIIIIPDQVILDEDGIKKFQTINKVNQQVAIFYLSTNDNNFEKANKKFQDSVWVSVEKPIENEEINSTHVNLIGNFIGSFIAGLFQ